MTGSGKLSRKIRQICQLSLNFEKKWNICNRMDLGPPNRNSVVTVCSVCAMFKSDLDYCPFFIFFENVNKHAVVWGHQICSSLISIFSVCEWLDELNTFLFWTMWYPTCYIRNESFYCLILITKVRTSKPVTGQHMAALPVWCFLGRVFLP